MKVCQQHSVKNSLLCSTKWDFFLFIIVCYPHVKVTCTYTASLSGLSSIIMNVSVEIHMDNKNIMVLLTGNKTGAKILPFELKWSAYLLYRQIQRT